MCGETMKEKTKAEWARIDDDEIPLPSSAAARRHSPTSILLNGVHYCRRIVKCSRPECGFAAVRRIVTSGDASAAVRDSCPFCGLTKEMPLGEDGQM